ncbi:MAG: type II toxin-antitoxin system HicB family antitoxin [Verrucomicrobiae bacterium]|nr:type II toxin-antitoxin system HicB family antitoxin [Verrucomicrobiae bacterium]MCP5550247.1 type II toxin-antitoxin system HicB family antitoxin [Akkermansiaceae bacterium]
MTYKGYESVVSFDDEAGLFHGEVVGLRDVVTFQGTSVEELRRAFEESVDDYLDFCASRGEEPDRAYSGKFMLRIAPELHRRLALLSIREGKSLNRWIEDQLGEHAACNP